MKDAARTDDPALPGDFRIALDPTTRRIDDGRVVLGGSPITLLRLSAGGAAILDELAEGAPIGDQPARQRLVRRLLATGVAHPRPGRAVHARTDVTVVVPAHNRPAGVADTLAALQRTARGARVVVVDDGSDPADRDRTAAIAAAAGAALVALADNCGPAAARNAGLDGVDTEIVAFIDADVTPHDGWLDAVLAHFADPAVAAVAPRVVTPSGDDRIARYEHRHSPLDLGPHEARVAPGSRVAYLPAAALVVRATALRHLGGFDVALRAGEDVDLVWRVIDRGHTVRYVPEATVGHPPRADLAAWARQRFLYGTAAGALDQRHPGAVAPLVVSGWTAAAWGLAAGGFPLAGVAVGAAAMAMLPAKLQALQHPWRESMRLAGQGQLAAWRPIASAVSRSWWPIAAAASLASRRARRATIAALVVPPLVDWHREHPDLDAPTYVTLRVLDDLAYGAGVWAGCVHVGSLHALAPRLHSWPGRRPQR